MTPDGVVSHLSQPYMSREGDWFLYQLSDLDQKLRQLNRAGGDLPGQRVYIYGDSAYYRSYGVIGAYGALPGRPLNDILKAINTHISGMRISVEHRFLKILMLWNFNGYKKLKAGLSLVAA